MNELDKLNKYTGSKEDIRTGFGGDWTEHKVSRGQALDRHYGRGGTKNENLDYSRALMSDLEWLIIGKDAKDYVRWDFRPEMYDDVHGPELLPEVIKGKGAQYLKGIVERFPHSKKDEFYKHLSNMENTYNLGGEDRGREKYGGAWESMQGFLQENLISPMEPMKLRRIEDKVMDGFIQQDTKYNMGE